MEGLNVSLRCFFMQAQISEGYPCESIIFQYLIECDASYCLLQGQDFVILCHVMLCYVTLCYLM